MGEMDDELHGYLDHTMFGTARDAIGASIAWLGWLLGIVCVVLGVIAPVHASFLIVVGGVILFGMALWSLHLVRERRRCERIAQLPDVELPHVAYRHEEVRLHIEVPEHPESE
jgi:Flp pilus assembly protein TadB